MATDQFLGYRRGDGGVGIRNLVALVTVMDNSNPVSRRIAAQVAGTLPLCPSFGRAQMGDDWEQHVRALAGLGGNPNVYGAIVVSLEPESARQVAERIAATKRPVETLVLQDPGGTVGAVERGVRFAHAMAAAASAQAREPAPLSALTLGVECGGSDSTSGMAGNAATGLVADRVVDAGGTVVLSEPVEWMGGEHLLARRAVDAEVAKRIGEVVKWYEDYAASRGLDLMGANPAPDNIAGGLSTIEEKALGAIKKGGSRPVQEVVGYGVRPTRRGLVLMDAPAPAVENMTAMAAGGCQVIIFSTGKGNPVGNPVAPTIKVSGNPRTVATWADNLDLGLAGIMGGTQTLAEAAGLLYTELLAVAGGKRTKAEILGDVEIAISRIGFSM